jgi:hypothetical protein
MKAEDLKNWRIMYDGREIVAYRSRNECENHAKLLRQQCQGRVQIVWSRADTLKIMVGEDGRGLSADRELESGLEPDQEP